MNRAKDQLYNDESKEHDLLICRCEEVRESEIRQAISEGRVSVTAIKKATRAGMVACQGRTCSRLIEQILKSAGIEEPIEDKVRFPIVPCKIEDYSDIAE